MSIKLELEWGAERLSYPRSLAANDRVGEKDALAFTSLL